MEWFKSNIKCIAPANANLVPASHTTLSVVKIYHSDTWHTFFYPGLHCRMYNFKVPWGVICQSLRTLDSYGLHNSLNDVQFKTALHLLLPSASKDSKEGRCSKCEQLKSKNSRWTNLLLHLKLCVGKDFALQYVEHADATRVQQQHTSCVGIDGNSAPAATMNSFVLCLSNADKGMAEWISYLVEQTQPISLVTCPAMQRLTKLKPVSSKLVQKHILSLMTVVKKYLKHCLPAKFALVFDGWTKGTDHYYIGIWTSYNRADWSDNGREHPAQTLLSIRPLLPDGFEGITAQDHLWHINAWGLR